MYYNDQNTSASFFRFFLVSALLLVCIGCDSVLPDEFKAKNFTAADIDSRAGNLLTKDTLNDSQGATISYQYAPIDSSGTTIGYRILPVRWSVVSSQTLASFATQSGATDNQIISSKFNAITSALGSLTSDSLILVSYPAGQRVTYAVLKSSSSKNIYIYTSLQYHSGNINDYVSVELVKSDTSTVSTSTALSPEAAYGSIENILVNGSTRTVPVISARYTAHVDQGGVYLVRFTLSNPQTISNPLPAPLSSFGLPSIANQFKVVILSF